MVSSIGEAGSTRVQVSKYVSKKITNLPPAAQSLRRAKRFTFLANICICSTIATPTLISDAGDAAKAGKVWPVV